MKAVGQLRILNQQPFILISHYDLCAIQHIVDLAPKEAQWYHRVEQMETEGGGIAYRIYEMYIPEQWCSGAEVESDPEMFIPFYKELLEEHGQEKANEIIQTMDAWCHSHHNMGVSPSGQDVKQFKEQCERAEKDGKEGPQIMMIFNKKDDYYCRIWDPKNNLMFENVELVVGDYDFDWINEQAKEKFKTRKIKTHAKPGKKNPGSYTWGWQNDRHPGLIDFSDFEDSSPYYGEAKKKSKKKVSGKRGKAKRYSPYLLKK